MSGLTFCLKVHLFGVFFLRSLSRPERPQVQASHAGALRLALVTWKLEHGAAAGVVQVFRASAAGLKEDAVCFLPFYSSVPSQRFLPKRFRLVVKRR